MQFLIRLPAGGGQMCVVRAMANRAVTCSMPHSLISLIFLHLLICLRFLDFRMVGHFTLCITRTGQEQDQIPNQDIFQFHCKTVPCLRSWMLLTKKVHSSDHQKNWEVGFCQLFLESKSWGDTCLRSPRPEGSTHYKPMCQQCQSSVLDGCAKTSPATAVLIQHLTLAQRGKAQRLPAMQKHTQPVHDRQVPCPDPGLHCTALGNQGGCAQVRRRNRVGRACTYSRIQDGRASGSYRPSDSLLQPLSDMMKELREGPHAGKANMHIRPQQAACTCEAIAWTSQPLSCSLNVQQSIIKSPSIPRMENKMPPFQGVVVDLANILRRDEAGYLHSGRKQADHQHGQQSPTQVGPKCAWSLDRKDMRITAQAMPDSIAEPSTMRQRRMQLPHMHALLMLWASYAALYWVAWAFRTPITHARFTCRLRCGIYRRRPRVLLAVPLVSALRRWLWKLMGNNRAQLNSCQSADVDCSGLTCDTRRHSSIGALGKSHHLVCGQQGPNGRSTSRKWTEAPVQEVERRRSRHAEDKTECEGFLGASACRAASLVYTLSSCLRTALSRVNLHSSMLKPFSVVRDAPRKASPIWSDSCVLAWASVCYHLLHRQDSQFLHSIIKAAIRRIMHFDEPLQQHPFPCDRQGSPLVALRSSMGHSCRAEQSQPQCKSPWMNLALVHLCTLFIAYWWRSTSSLHKENSCDYGSRHAVSAAEAGRKTGQGCKRRKRKLHAFLVLITLLQCITTAKATLEPSVGGSADLRPPECPPYEASRHIEQIGAERNGQSTTTGNRHITRPVRKRAFIRAQNRAARNGETVYRGRRMTASQLGVQQQPRMQPKREQGSIPCPKNAFRYLCWNAGGLTIEKYQELKHWLTTSDATQFHLICIQETQWSNDSEYEFGQWSVIHSGSGSRSGGLLCIIHRSLAAPTQIKSQAPLPGRLLHIRLTTEPAIDLLLVYQHSWLDSQASRDKLLGQRADVWAKISGWIAAIPRRSLCCVMGDLNTEVRHDGRCIGRGTMFQREPRQKDWHMWSDMVKTHDLCLLNTWGKQGPQARTYIPASGRGGSQIDFIALRQVHMQPWCKAVKPTTLPFANVHGMRHVALTGQLPRPSPPRKAHVQNSAMLTLRKAQSVMSQDPHILQRMQQVLRSSPLQCHSGDISVALNQVWTTAMRMGERAQGRTPIILPVQQVETAVDSPTQDVSGRLRQDKSALIRNLWQLRRQIQNSLQKCRMDMPSLFQRWRLACTYSIRSRQLSKECRLTKARKITKLVQEAEANGSASLVQVHKISKKIAPKTRHRKIQFRDESGLPLSNQAELEMITAYYKDLYNPNPNPIPSHIEAEQQVRGPETNHLDITLQEVQQALQKLPKNKALPKHHAPAILWATFSEDVAPLVYKDLCQWCSDMTQQLPHDWSCAQVCLMPKPNKPPHAPAALRPISLLPPVAKALAHIAAQRLQPYLQPLLERFQQFAYVRGREVHDAIERAAAHCAQARALMATQQRSIHKLKNGVRCAPCRPLSPTKRYAEISTPHTDTPEGLAQLLLTRSSCSQPRWVP